MRRFLFCFLLCFQITTLVAQVKNTSYERIEAFVEDMAMVMKDGKYGFVNYMYKEVIPPVYISAFDFSEGLAAVELYDSVAIEEGTGTWIFIDKNGRQVIPGKYEFVHEGFKEGLVIVESSGKRKVINREGKVVAEEDPFRSIYYKHGMASAWKDSVSHGLINLKGEVIVPMQYEMVQVLTPQIIAVYKQGQYGFYNASGKKLTKLEYRGHDILKNGFVAVEKKGKWGVLNKAGEVIVKPKYDDIDDYQEGLAIVERKEKKGFIDEAGKEVVPVKYDDVDKFLNGRSSVTLKGKEFYIDKRGKLVDEHYTDLPFLTALNNKETAEQVFVDLLNSLTKEYPSEGYDNSGRMMVDSLFTIKNGVLSGSFREYTPNGPRINKIIVPVAKLQEVWYDYNMGVYVDDDAGIVQTTLPGSTVTEEYKTGMLHLVSPGDGHHGRQWQAKLEVALKAVKRFYP